jgi:hypothetical protein
LQPDGNVHAMARCGGPADWLAFDPPQAGELAGHPVGTFDARIAVRLKA